MFKLMIIYPNMKLIDTKNHILKIFIDIRKYSSYANIYNKIPILFEKQ